MMGDSPPEFSEILKLSNIGSAPIEGEIAANPDQCAALATRFDLPSIESFSADYMVNIENDRIIFKGILAAKLHQSCAISGQKFPVAITEPFNIAFVEKTDAENLDQEVELDSDDCDILEYENAQFDIGEALAQTLYLALDPYPRGPNADIAAKKLTSEEEAGPFGALAALKDKLD